MGKVGNFTLKRTFPECMRSMMLGSEEQGLNQLRWSKQTEEPVESIEELYELSRFVLILYQVELDESKEGLDELNSFVMTKSCKGTRRIRGMSQRVESTRGIDFDFDWALTLTKFDL